MNLFAGKKLNVHRHLQRKLSGQLPFLGLTGINTLERPELRHLVTQVAGKIGNALVLALLHRGRGGRAARHVAFAGNAKFQTQHSKNAVHRLYAAFAAFVLYVLQGSEGDAG